MANPLVELMKLGQSVWFDQMERALVTEGKLAQMIEEDDLRGLTSNPTIFDKAIGGSDDYDDQIRDLAAAGKSRDEIYEAIVVEDISRAADVFRPVYDRTKGDDGYCSLEVSPILAPRTQDTIAEAAKLWKLLGRPNVMIKIPATPEGIPAIEETIAAGINVNVTLIFSQAVYRKVMEAYIRGLERRAEKGLPIDSIASVASFFVSRIDSKADKEIEKKGASDLLGKVAIANAKMAYQLFKEQFGNERFAKLKAKGARVQRPLWASTGTKNPKYSDVLYIEELVAKDTVNTVPPATYNAFKDHGKPRLSIEEDLEGAKNVLARLEKEGISLENITNELTEEGVKSFIDSFVSLMNTIEARRDVVVRATRGHESSELGSMKDVAEEALRRVEKEKFAAKIWAKDGSLWKSEESHKKMIPTALGWLGVVESMHGKAAELKSFADEIKRDFKHVVILGMGGSSLCSEVLRTAFGNVEGYPELHVLDSTVPAAIRALEKSIDLEKSLFIVASKSGTTTEPQMFHKYFYDRVKRVKGDRAGENFIAITDPDTQLKREAERDKFRRTFINPADIGGRYSALSYFGMVPAALMGVDVEAFLDRALHATHICAPALAAHQNRGALLGTILGSLALKGRDKLTLVANPPFTAFGLWAEQLIAESTGKEGKGIIPIATEPLLTPRDYGDDRVFVGIRLHDVEDVNISGKLGELRAAGHPVLLHALDDEIDLGDEFFIWEFATAVAGALLGINPFDQPNVQESKDNTKRLLDEFKSKGSLTDPAVVGEEKGVRVFGDSGFKPKNGRSLTDVMTTLFETVKPGDYVALMEFIEETPEHNRIISEIRSEIMRGLRIATTSGYGPRFLHSTGQLHKGGADNGIFIQITKDDADDLPIPGEPFTFGTLKQAQALGDFQSLLSRQRRAVRVHVGNDVEAGLKRLLEAVQQAMAPEPV